MPTARERAGDLLDSHDGHNMAKLSFQNCQRFLLAEVQTFISRAAVPLALWKLLLGREVSSLPLFWEELWMF